ncbi:hypothetical protein Tco_1476742 [Tanacetum coccineum]
MILMIEEDEDDYEGPSAGSNQGRSAKRRRPESAASGSAQPPSKNDHQSSKKPRESDASAFLLQLFFIPTLTSTEAANIMKALKESKKMSKRQPGTGGSNDGTGNILGVPDESTVISRASSEGTGSKPGVPDEEKLILYSGPAPSVMTPGYISSGLVQISVSPTPYVPPSKKDYEILSGPVLHEMMSDHNSSVLAPHRQEMSVENVSQPRPRRTKGFSIMTTQNP